MSKIDEWVNSIIVVLLLVHASVWAFGYFTNRLLYLVSFLNLAVGVAIIAYWVAKQFQIQQHNFDALEIAVLCFETIVIAAAVYSIFTSTVHNWLKVTQYIFFGIHFLVLIAAIIFMLTFKINKLF